MKLVMISMTDEKKVEAVEEKLDGPTRNSKVLRSFVTYCETHPHERCWQALRNWCGYSFVFASKDGGIVLDTSNWEGERE